MYYGVQYYPEHWPEDRWAVDARMMREAGVNTVRMGEFAWSAIEPEQGRYDFGWLDRAIALLYEHGIRTILCTMSRTPPPWAFQAWPDIMNTPRDGRSVTYGVRYSVGLAHERFREVSERIDRAVVEHFSGNEAIVGWQIDNEVGSGNDCYCDQCRAAFHRYLEEKYGTVEALNDAWGRHFWSLTYTSFDEVPLPLDRANPQLALEYRRFMSHVNVDFATRRTAMIRELDPGKWITTNFQSFHAVHTDYFALEEAIDVNGMNHYPFRSPELLIDYYRSARGKVHVLEQFTRLAEVDDGPGWMRLWAWMAIAHGASGMSFFRWRRCRWGQEQHKDGILPHSGEANRRYRELAQMGDEIARIGGLIDTTSPRARVAIVLSYESRWAVLAGLERSDWDGAREAVGFHRELTARNITVDALDPRGDLSGYALVIAPRVFCVDDATTANLTAFVEHGGTLCLTAGSGVVDEYNVSFATPRPGPLAGLAGIEVGDLLPMDDPTVIEPVAGSPGAGPVRDGGSLAPARMTGIELADEVSLVDATEVARFASGWRAGTPAVTMKESGRGRTVYLAASLDDTSFGGFAEYLLGLVGVESPIATPPGVRVYNRSSDSVELRFVLNYTNEEREIDLGEGWTDAFSGEACGSVRVPAVDLRVVRRG